MPIPPPSMSRLSTSSPVPPSPRRTNIPRPSSTASTASHTRMTSTSGVTPPRSAQMEQAESKGDAEIRNVRVGEYQNPYIVTPTAQLTCSAPCSAFRRNGNVCSPPAQYPRSPYLTDRCPHRRRPCGTDGSICPVQRRQASPHIHL
jgi:hypothetical protein